MSTVTTAETSSHLEVDDRGAAVVVTLNRPDQRNALSLALMQELTDALQALASRSGTRSIILRAAGPAFSAGHDLRELAGRTKDEEREIFRVCTQLMDTIQGIGQPVIAAIQGSAAAAGCQLVASCDLAVAADDASFSTPGVKIGLFCSTPMVALSRNIGRKRALEMLLTGQAISAETAASWGLINRVVPSSQLMAEAQALAETVGRFSPLTLGVGKAAFYQQDEVSQGEAYELMRETMASNAMAADAQEGIAAFLEKRQPNWRGV